MAPGGQAAYVSGGVGADARSGAYRAAAGNGVASGARTTRARTFAKPTTYHREIVTVGHDKNLAKTEVYDQNQPESESEKVVRCVTKGVMLHVAITPSPRGDLVHVEQECRH
jgi:hypothetical protein